jgi:hypothetical protein
MARLRAYAALLVKNVWVLEIYAQVENSMREQKAKLAKQSLLFRFR